MSILDNIPAWLTMKVATVGILIMLFIGGYVYISYLSSRIDSLIADNNNLKNAVNQQKDVIDQLQKDYLKSRELADQYTTLYKKLQDDAKRLEDELYREKYGKDSIEELILQDTHNHVQNLINAATRNLMRCFEVITGAPLKPSEKLQCP